MAPNDERGPAHVLLLPTLLHWPVKLVRGTTHFALFLACDARDEPPERLAQVARSALSQGAIFVSIWGPGCERVEAAFVHEAGVGTRNADEDTAATTVTTDTVSHPQQTIDEALAFFELAARVASKSRPVPSPAFRLGVVVGSDRWFRTTCSVLFR